MRIILYLLFLVISISAFAEKGEKFLVINPNGHKGTIKAMDIDSKGRIITAGYDKTVKIWNSQEGILERQIFGEIGPGSEGLIYSMALSDDDKYLATGGWFGNSEGAQKVGDIRIYSYKTGRQVAILEGHVQAVIDLEFYSHSNFLFSLDGDGNVLLWDIDEKVYTQINTANDKVLDIEGVDGFLFTAHQSGFVHKWDVTKLEKPVATYKNLAKDGRPAMTLAVTTDGSKIAVSSANYVYFLNAKLKENYSFYHGDDPITKMSFSPDATRIVIASSSPYLKENLMRVYEDRGDGWYTLSAFRKHSDAVSCAGFITNSTCVTAGGRDNEIAVWKVEETKKVSPLIHWMCGVGKPIHSVGMDGAHVSFATTWSKNDGYSAFEYIFDLSNRSVRKYTENDSCHFPILNMNDYSYTVSESLTVLSIKKENKTVAKITADYTNGSMHNVVTFVNEELIATGGGYGALNVYDLEGKLVSRLINHEGDIRGLAVSTDGKFLISGSQDQTICIWKIDEIGTKEILSPVVSLFVGTNNEWVIWNGEGYFMSSKKGASYVGFHINQGPEKEARFYPFEQFDIQYNRPDIIMQSLGFIDQSIIDLYRAAYQKRLARMGISENDLSTNINAPVVSLKPGTPVKGRVTFGIMATDSLYNLKSLHVYLNDVPVFGRNGMSLENLNSKTYEKSIDLELMSGLNKIQICVINSAGVESLKETTTINNAVESNSELYVVSVGVSNYKDSSYNLDYAAKDAEDVNTLFGASTHFKKVNQKVLVNDQVTKKNLVELKSFLSEAKRDDIVIFFIAGHGVLNKTLDYYYCTWDMDFQAPEKYGISYSELEVLFDGIKAIRKLLIMDTCHSGEVDKNDLEEVAFVNTENEAIAFRTTNTTTSYREVQGLEKTNEAVKEMFNDLRRGTGATVISSAGGAEYAMESDQWKNGLFTYCLLEGLQTKNADTDKNNEIMLSELQNYIALKVAELSKGRQMPTSRTENLYLDYRIW